MSTPVGLVDWQTQNYTLDDAVALTGLPCVLKVRQSRDQGASYGKTVVRIEKWKALPCVRMEFVQSSDMDNLPQDDAEGEFLVPLEYHGRVRLPGSSIGKNYSTVAEVIEDLPNFVKLDDEIFAYELGTKGCKFLSPGTVLQIIRLQPRKDATGNENELICAYQNWKILLKSSCSLSCTSLSGTAETTFDSVIANFPLPKCFKFVEQENTTIEQLGGLTDLSSRIFSENVIAKDVDFKRVLVGVQRKIGGENALIIIPEESRNMFESVQIPKNWSPAVLKEVTTQYFPSLIFDDYLKEIQRKLYAIAPTKQQNATGLQRSMSQCVRPMLPKRDVHGQQNKGSQDGEAKTGQRKVKEYLHMVALRSKAGFDKVHQEIKHRFKRNKKMRPKKHLYDDIEEIEVKLQPDKETEAVKIRKFKTLPVSSLMTGDKRAPIQVADIVVSSSSFNQQKSKEESPPYQTESITKPPSPSFNGNAMNPAPPSNLVSVPSSTDTAIHTRSQSPLIPEGVNQQSLPLHPTKVHQTPIFSDGQNIFREHQQLSPTDRITQEARQLYTPEGDDAKKPSSLVQQKSCSHIQSVTSNQNTNANEQRSDPATCQALALEPLEVIQKSSRPSQQLSVINNSGQQSGQDDPVPDTPVVHHHYVDVQGAEMDFSSLRVKEVVKLYHDCGMDDFAVVCDVHAVDGYFLTQLPKEDLEKSPFNLSKFHITKFKKIMSGWRPKLSKRIDFEF